MKGRVVHCKKESYDVYIGRPGPWGNPFPLKHESERDEVIEKYRAWLEQEIEAGRIKESAVLALDGKTLGCWCAPRRCHGDVLLEKAAELKEKSQG